ncbi:MAG: hypothetical protein II923_01505 [Campylobacter sp.]|nr:hypothetical protein [Campylobacter sp.]
MLKKIVIFVCLWTNLFAGAPLENNNNDICVMAINALLNSNTDLNSENYQTYEWFAKQFHREEFDKVKRNEFEKYALYDKLKQEVPDVRKFLKEKYDDVFGIGVFTYADKQNTLRNRSDTIGTNTYKFEKNAFVLELAKRSSGGHPFSYHFSISNEHGYNQCDADIKLYFDNAPLNLTLQMDRNEANELLKSMRADTDNYINGEPVYLIEYKVVDSKLNKLGSNYGTIYATVNAHITGVMLHAVYNNMLNGEIVDIKTIADWDIK